MTSIPGVPASAESVRDGIRAKILASENTRGKSKIVTFFGANLELRQPNVGQIIEMASNPNALSFTSILINYAYVPGGGDVKVFDLADEEMLAKMPYNTEVDNVINAMASLTNMSVKEAEKK